MGSRQSSEELAEALAAWRAPAWSHRRTARAPHAHYAGVLPGAYEVAGAVSSVSSSKTPATRRRRKEGGLEGTTTLDSGTKRFRLGWDASWPEAGFDQTEQRPVVGVVGTTPRRSVGGSAAGTAPLSLAQAESQWEYACRAGTTHYAHGDDPDSLAQVANVADATTKAALPIKYAIRATDGYVFTAPVGCFQPNRWGLYDMHGNAAEWCADWYGDDYYRRSPADDPQGPDSGTARLLRGGSWGYAASDCRSANRNWGSPRTETASMVFGRSVP